MENLTDHCCTKNLYDENYYERGIEKGLSCYSNYRWIPELTIPMAARLIEYLGIGGKDRILDFGCAKGYLVKAFRLLHREAYGFEISEYAKNTAPHDVRKYYIPELKGHFDWTIAKDVFEHIEYDQLQYWLCKIHDCSKSLFAVCPLGNVGGGGYVVPAYELDKTHIIRENLDWWKEQFELAGYIVISADYKVQYLKENWSEYEKGNGFFICRSRE